LSGSSIRLQQKTKSYNRAEIAKNFRRDRRDLKPGVNPCIKWDSLVPDTQPHHRRVTVIASGLLCGILALVVIFTNRAAFFSPLTVVVVAAIGAAAVLLQLRLRNREQAKRLRPPAWLNILGILLALLALFGDHLHLSSQLEQLLALGAVVSFAVSSVIILHAFRKDRLASK
jgi:peptidoglycan/LPS O-acetylase OafA/YrhL